jgi:hypothetical protein
VRPNLRFMACPAKPFTNAHNRRGIGSSTHEQLRIPTSGEQPPACICQQDSE